MRSLLASGSVQNFCLSIVCAWALLPQLAHSTVARILSLLAVAIWLTIEVFKPDGIVRKPTLPFLILVLFVVYTLILELMTHGASGIVSRIQLYIMLFFLVVQQSRRNDMHSLVFIFWLVIILTIFSMTSTLFYVTFVDPRAMRTIVRSSDAAQELVQQGIGGYSLAYGAVLMLPVLLVLSLRPALINQLTPIATPRLLAIVLKLSIWYLTALSVLLVFSSQYSISVITLLVSMIVVMVLWRITILRALLAVVLLLILLLFSREFMIDFLVHLAPLVEGTNYALKVNDLLFSLRLENADGTFNARIERYWHSFILFLENPITGVLYFGGFGGHSTILDTFARWGFIMGAIMLYLLSFLQFKALRALRPIPGGGGAALGALVAVLMIFGLNVAFMTAGIVIYIIYPLVFSALQHEQARYI